MLQKTLAAAATKAGAPRTFRFRISDGSPDRQHDRINVQGWRLANYQRAPIVLWSHDHSIPAIAKCTAIGVEGTGASAALMATAEFAPPGIHPLADQVHDLVASGIIASTSVGLVAESEQVARNELGGWDINAQELIEWSIVNAGALPTALLVGRSANAPAIQKWLGGSGADPDGNVEVLTLEAEPPVRRAGHSRLRGRPLDEDGAIALTLDDDDEDTDVVALVLRGGRRISLKAGARHNSTDRQMIQQAHDLTMALGAECAKEASNSGDDGAELAFSEDLVASARAALARQRRQFSDPMNDPAAHRRHIAGNDIDISADDLTSVLREIGPGLIRDAVRGAVPEAISRALRMARGRVD